MKDTFDNPMPRPIIVAHRGLHEVAPENSYGAIRAAELEGFDWIECDVWNSLDGIPIVIHDRTLERTTNGKGNVDECGCSELASIRLLDCDGRPCETERLPYLSDFVGFHDDDAKLLPPMRLIEIKPLGALQLIREIILGNCWVSGDMIQSFDEANLIHSLACDERIPVAYLIEDRRTLEKAVADGWDRLHLFHQLLDASTADWLRRKGVAYGAWTPNTEEDIRRVRNLGASMVITDEPVLARTIIEGLD